MSCRPQPRDVVWHGLTLGLAVSTLGACTHVLHPADVQPGFGLQAGVGVAHETTRGDPVRAVDLLVSGSWGKRFNEDQGLQLTLTVPWSITNRDDGNDQFMQGLAMTNLDVYVQVLGAAVDLGLGAIVGVAPGLYFEGGQSFTWNAGRLDLALGLRVHAAGGPVVVPFGLAVFTLPGGLRLGVWADGVVDADYTCDCAPDDEITGRVAGGALVGTSL